MKSHAFILVLLLSCWLPTAAQESRSMQQMPVQQNYQPSIFQNYFSHNGNMMISWASVGYTTCFYLNPPAGQTTTSDAFQRHLLSFQILEYRYQYVGISVFNFEMAIPFEKGVAGGYSRTNTDGTNVTGKDIWFGWKPSVKFYIPCTSWLAVEAYGGCEMDFSCPFRKINPLNPASDDNWFVAPFGGIGLMFTPLTMMPIEVKAEYRHPVNAPAPHNNAATGNLSLIPQGFYLTFQIHLAHKLR